MLLIIKTEGLNDYANGFMPTTMVQKWGNVFLQTLKRINKPKTLNIQ